MRGGRWGDGEIWGVASGWRVAGLRVLGEIMSFCSQIRQLGFSNGCSYVY